MSEQNLKTSKQKLKNWIIFTVILIIVFVAGYIVIEKVPFFANKRLLIVISDSMEPTIGRGDLAIVNTAFEVDTLEENTIIAFYTDINDDGKDEIIVHYIAQVTQEEGVNIFRTKRENVTSYIDWDAWELTEDDIIGTHLYHVKNLGRFVLFLDSIFGKIVLAVDIIVILGIVSIFSKDDKNKKAQKNNLIKKGDKMC